MKYFQPLVGQIYGRGSQGCGGLTVVQDEINEENPSHRERCYI